MVRYEISRINEKSVTLDWEEKIDISVHREVMFADELVSSSPFVGWIENVPAYHTLTIYFDPYIIYKAGIADSNSYIRQYLSGILKQAEISAGSQARSLQIPVCYDPSLGLDLEEVADLLQLTTADVISMHCAEKYRVFMLGFQPGFPYMGILPEKMFLPRKAKPRLLMPAGTVAIVGRQTGIYPFDAPAGWYALGRTPLTLFSNGKALFEPGDEVSFYAVSLEEYNKTNTLGH